MYRFCVINMFVDLFVCFTDIDQVAALKCNCDWINSIDVARLEMAFCHLWLALTHYTYIRSIMHFSFQASQCVCMCVCVVLLYSYNEHVVGFGNEVIRTLRHNLKLSVTRKEFGLIFVILALRIWFVFVANRRNLLTQRNAFCFFFLAGLYWCGMTWGKHQYLQQ